MGQTRYLKGKIIFKHQTAAEWELPNDGAGAEYKPDIGELIIYDPDETHPYIRLKFGNGTDIVKNLPFAFAEKVDIADIINTLTSDAVDHPLSAAQGKELKRLLDELDNSFNESINNIRYNYIPKTEKGAANGVASLSEEARIPAAQLPINAVFVDTNNETVTDVDTNIHSSIQICSINNGITVIDTGLTYNRGVVEVRKIGEVLWIIDSGVYNFTDNFSTAKNRTVLQINLPKELSNKLCNVNGAYGSTGTIGYFPALAYENVNYTTFNCQSYLKRSAIGETYDTFQLVYTGLSDISAGGLCGFHLKMPLMLINAN